MGGAHSRHHGVGGLLLLSVVLVAAAWAAGCDRKEPKQAPAGTVGVGVTIPPQADFVRRVGGQHVRVTILVQPGGNPHTYEPTPQQVTELARVDVFFTIGVPFEKALLSRIEAVNPTMRVVDTGKGITLRSMSADELRAEAEHEQEHEHEGEGNMDPHTWLDPRNVKVMAKSIADALAGVDSAHQDEYAANLAKFQAELDELDAYIRARCKDLTSHDFMVYHPAFGYFAQAYGLRQVPIELEGKEPSAQTLASTIDFARSHGIKVVFVQRQFSLRASQAVAEAIGGRVVPMDDLAESYIPNMKAMADAFAETME